MKTIYRSDMKPIRVTVSRDVYREIDGIYTWCLPLKKRYSRMIPDRAFALGEDDVLIAEKPEEIVFRRRWTLQRKTRKIRMAVLQHEEADGKDDVFIKLYLI